MRRLGLIALALVLTACASLMSPFNPPIKPPPTPPTLGLTDADRFSAGPAGAALPSALDLQWWQRFDDPVLGRWVESALANSPSVDIARERVVQAEALLRGARAQRSPLLGAEASAEARSRREADQRASDPRAALTLDWDLDLGGGLRQAEMSAAAAVLRSEDWLQAARLSVAGLTARAYVEWQEARLDQRLLADELALQAEVLRIVQVRVRAGPGLRRRLTWTAHGPMPQLSRRMRRMRPCACDKPLRPCKCWRVSAHKLWSPMAAPPACPRCKVSRQCRGRLICCGCAPTCALPSVHWPWLRQMWASLSRPSTRACNCPAHWR